METSPTRHRAVMLAVTLLSLGAVAACTGAPGSNPSTPAASSTSSATSPAPSPTSVVSPTASTAAGSTTPTSAPPDASSSCAERVSKLTLAQQVGELLMVGVTSTGLTAAQGSALAESHAGSAILLGNSKLGAAGTALVVSDVRDAADPPTRIATVVAADQEGGRAQRLNGIGFSDMPSAQRQSLLADAALATSAAGWARELDRAGVNVNLAPVADVVPAKLLGLNPPIGQLRRGYGPSPDVVAAKVTTFIQGMDESNLGTAVRHFPGLGRVRGNTDVTRRVVDSVTTRNDPTLAGFKAAVAAKTEMVMVSSAYYSKIDRLHRATFSPVIIDGMLRGDLGFTGVVVSDDLSAAAMRDLPPGQRAVRFIQAGGDLATVGDAAEAVAMADALVVRAESDSRFADRVARSATRVVDLKAGLGLADCD